jgi:hypothetical protein
MPCAECDDSPSKEATPQRLERENELLRQQLHEQLEKLRLLEDQIRLANIQDQTSRQSEIGTVTRRRSQTQSSTRRRTRGVGFCEDVLCYANTRSFEQIVESWYSVSS